MDDYSRGMDMLRLYSSAFATLAAGLGYPIPNPNIPTARVVLNTDTRRIAFEINPTFLHELKDSDVASVIGHETYHVLLNHLSEVPDRKAFPRYDVLTDAQECIINDGLPGNIGFEIIEGAFRGPERHNHDFSLFSTKEGYDFIMAKLQENEDQDQSDDDSQDGQDQSDSGNSEGDQESNNSGEGQGDSEGDSADSSEDDNSQAGKGGASADSAEGDADGDAQGSSQSGAPAEGDASSKGCGGAVVEGENLDSLSPQELKDLVGEILGEQMNEALDSLNGSQLPAHVEDMLDELENDGDIELPNRPSSSGYGEGQGKSGFNTINEFSNMKMNWVDLLAKINPKVKSSGRPKTRDSWHQPRRRMVHSYPQVILPTTRRLDDANSKKGDSVPTFILALDMSGSIPEKYLQDLAAFAMSLPSDLIKGYPITWSDNFRVFNPERPREIVPRSGTRISSVIGYANKIEQETGTKPYVLVITDGEFALPANADLKTMKEKWFWMALQPKDVRTINSRIPAAVTPNNVFSLVDFI